MNKVILNAGLQEEPNVRYTHKNGSQELPCVRHVTTLQLTGEVLRGQQSADFLSHGVAFGKKPRVCGKISENREQKLSLLAGFRDKRIHQQQTGKRYMMDVVIEEQGNCRK